jgi:ribosomal protein S6
MNDQPKYYQLTYLLPPSLDEKGVVEIGQKIKKLVKDKQGKIEKEETVNRNLAYPIRKYQQAVYSNLSFQIIPESIKEIQEYLKLEDNILRYAIQREITPGSPHKSEKPARVKIGPAKVYPSFDPSRHDYLKEKEMSKINLDETLKNKSREKLSAAQPQREKVKLEEIDKKLEEILNE